MGHQGWVKQREGGKAVSMKTIQLSRPGQMLWQDALLLYQ